jgi:diamine N-acetyltransferase
MFLKGRLIYLRALEPGDSDLLYRWENNLKLWPVSLTQVPFSRFILEEFVNAAHQDIYTNKQLRLICCSVATNENLGVVDLFEFDVTHSRSGLGIYIVEEHRNNGFASECIELMKQYAESVLHLKQLFVNISASNSASLALFEKAGFVKAGLKKCWHKRGLNSFEDVWFLQHINEEK